MSKKIFFIVLTCCFLVATFCVSFAGAPQVQHAPANVRAVLDRPDCLAAPLIVPPVVEPLNFPVDGTDWALDGGSYIEVVPTPTPFVGVFSLTLGGERSLYLYDVELNPVYVEFLGFSPSTDIVSSSDTAFMTLYSGPYSVAYSASDRVLSLYSETGLEFTVAFSGTATAFFRSISPVSVFDENDEPVSTGYYSVFIFNPAIVVSPVVDTLVSGLRALGTNVGRAFSTMANAIFINTDGSGLSTFGILVVVFSAISLGLSLTRWVLNFCSSWGKRNR